MFGTSREHLGNILKEKKIEIEIAIETLKQGVKSVQSYHKRHQKHVK